MQRVSIDRIVLQRLTDGELSGREQSELLSSIPECSPIWREIALSLLEDKILSRTLVSQDSTQAAFLTDFGLSYAGGKSNAIVHAGNGKGEAVRKSASRLAWLQIAASILMMTIGVGIGRTFNISGHSQSSAGEIAKSDPSINQASGVADLSLPVDQANAPERMRVGKISPDSFPPESRDNTPLFGRLQFASNGNSQVPFELPVYEVSQLEPNDLVVELPEELSQLRAQLRRRGVQLNVATELYEGSLPDGGRVVVPVNSVVAQPYGL